MLERLRDSLEFKFYKITTCAVGYLTHIMPSLQIQLMFLYFACLSE